MAVSPPATARANQVSTALIKLRIVSAAAPAPASKQNITVLYFRATAQQNTSAFISLGNLRGNGTEFYGALRANNVRYSAFVGQGAQIDIPKADVRYRDTTNSLLTMYMNLDRGPQPQYGGGKFWNPYNIYLPLDTLALNGALLEWGHVTEAQNYLAFFFNNMINKTNGAIIYNIFGCDSDADYGRLIHTFVKAVEYSSNTTFAAALLPIVHSMATRVLQRRAAAVGAFPASSPLHGIVAGSPEHDICGAPGYFFSINVWYVRSLLDLYGLHARYPALSINKTLEQQFLPAAEAWRQDIRKASNFTAVRRADGNGLFFLHPVVGSIYGVRSNTSKRSQPALKQGGNETTCVARGTCFASMSAPTADGGSNQQTNYANFRIFGETLLAGVLEPEYELAIMNYREAHRGTLMGMTRFRDGLDDMPILGYGRGSLHHDRLQALHTVLAGHSLNYLTRGTYWGTEQRQQSQSVNGPHPGLVDNRYRNNCGVGGEDCSLCMVSSVASAYWIRWLYATENADEAIVYLARGAPRRWYNQTESFGITDAPTRFGRASFTMQANVTAGRVQGSAVVSSCKQGCYADKAPLVAVRLHAASGVPFGCVSVSGAAVLVAWHKGNETALVRPVYPSAGDTGTAAAADNAKTSRTASFSFLAHNSC